MYKLIRQVVEKKIEATSTFNGNCYRAHENRQSVTCKGAPTMKQEQLSAICTFPRKPNGRKWPPDPPKPPNESTISKQPAHSAVFAIELPFAIIKQS